jgi:hypothetical protein
MLTLDHPVNRTSCPPRAPSRPLRKSRVDLVLADRAVAPDLLGCRVVHAGVAHVASRVPCTGDGYAYPGTGNF